MTPKFEHDCSNCRFIATVKEGDLYRCDELIVLRESDEGWNSRAMDIDFLKSNPNYILSRICVREKIEL